MFAHEPRFTISFFSNRSSEIQGVRCPTTRTRFLVLSKRIRLENNLVPEFAFLLVSTKNTDSGRSRSQGSFL